MKFAALILIFLALTVVCAHLHNIEIALDKIAGMSQPATSGESRR